jgi:uncharacterized 2Fe-2S/4Fe-4S cluster protein (DUF4445 family)
MAALAAGADIGTLSAYPFVVPENSDRLGAEMPFQDLLSERADVTVLPSIAAFVGGDALAAIVAAGLVEARTPTMLVDMGTNAEIVLALPGDRMVVASTAAGPAFEGVGISSGGPAALGAVERVELSSGELVLHAIGDAEPRWLSGAGLVSALAALRGSGHLKADGALRPEGSLGNRFGKDGSGVVRMDLSASDSAPMGVTQLDVRTVQLAKAAISAAVRIVLERASVSADELGEVLVAGAFGSALNPDDLVSLGVLPVNSAGRIRQVGNAALAGATAIALDGTLYDLAVDVAGQAVSVDLASDEHFNALFVSATEFAEYEV